MAKSRVAEAVSSVGNVGSVGIVSAARESDLRDAIAADLFVQMAPMAESRGKTIDCVAARSFEMADIFLRVRAERTAPPTE